MPAWEDADHGSIRATLSVSVQRLARAGADFFACPDNTAHLALEHPGEDLALLGQRIAEVAARRATAVRVGVLGTRYLMDGPVYPRAFTSRGIAAEAPTDRDRDFIDAIFDELPGCRSSRAWASNASGHGSQPRHAVHLASANVTRHASGAGSEGPTTRPRRIGPERTVSDR